MKDSFFNLRLVHLLSQPRTLFFQQHHLPDTLSAAILIPSLASTHVPRNSFPWNFRPLFRVPIWLSYPRSFDALFLRFLVPFVPFQQGSSLWLHYLFYTFQHAHKTLPPRRHPAPNLYGADLSRAPLTSFSLPQFLLILTHPRPTPSFLLPCFKIILISSQSSIIFFYHFILVTRLHFPSRSIFYYLASLPHTLINLLSPSLSLFTPPIARPFFLLSVLCHYYFLRSLSLSYCLLNFCYCSLLIVSVSVCLFVGRSVSPSVCVPHPSYIHLEKKFF